MRPKARVLAPYDGPSGWLEESDPAGVILDVMDRPYRKLFRAIPVALIQFICTAKICMTTTQLILQGGAAT